MAVSFSNFGWNALAQSVTGRISGAVTDGAGAAIAGASVKLTNTSTNDSRIITTDQNGFYVASSLPVGNYSVAVEHQGFKRATKTGYDLSADGRLTVDFALEAGNVSESVEIVGAAGETVNTTSGEVSRVVDQQQVQQLALNGRNYLQLTTLVPGVPLLSGNDDQLGLTTSLSVAQSVNGSRTNANSLTVDGGYNLDSGSNNSQVNNIGIDFIREVNIKTSNFSAEYGRNSGASINIVTRSGENSFHGSAFEYFRNDKLDANSFINNANGVAKPTLRFNDFGFALGGPIIKDKLFFFGGTEFKYIRRLSSSVSRTMPTQAERNGDFSAVKGLFLKDPLKSGNCNATDQTACFPNNIIPADRITADGKAIANVYSAMQGLAASYKDTPTANNAVFQQPNPFDNREDLVRIDYRYSDKHTIYGRYTHDKYDLIEPFGTFINSPLPTIPTNRLRPGYSVQLGHTWLISSSLINEAKITGAWNSQHVPPVGDFWKRDTYGFTFQQLFQGGGRYENSIPDVSFNGSGAVANFNGATNSLLSPTTDIAFSDNITWTRGAHTLKTGMMLIRNRKDQNGRTTYTGVVNFNPTGNPNSTGNAFADALLGNFRNYTEAANDPVGFFRFTEIDAFVSDSWKLSRRLSLEIGLRYQYGLPTYTQANNIANFDPALYDPAQAVTIKSDGNIDTTKGGNRFNGLVIAGGGVPSDELGRVPNGNSSLVASVPTGAPRGLYDPQHLVAPRFSFAYSTDDKTAIRGGFGIFYDKPEGNLIYSQLNLPPFSLSSQFNNGNLSNIAGAAAAAVAPFGNINAIDPNLVVPYQMNFSLSVQRELPWGIFGEAAYVGNLGRHLIRQPDINQPSFEALASNTAKLSLNALRPYKGYSAILMRLSDSNSNYNALQLYVTKRKGDLLMTAGYTWSKVLADTSGNGDNPDDPFNRSYSYGPADFDRRQVFFTSYTYQIPFFRSLKGVGGAALSSWEVSGITRWQTGHYLTPVTSSTAILASPVTTRRADYVGGDINQQGSNQLTQWFNTAAFATPPETRRGTAGVGIIEGPGRYLWDLSLRKFFTLREGIRLQFQADFFNAFNQTNLNDPNVQIGSSSYGTITGSAPSRNIQLGLKLTF
ncbi:MAG: TonB-dependent receptor [Blastocatellia bacterium]|nr:TonB-dependent receptor [Blastocatellia bacterium]